MPKWVNIDEGGTFDIKLKQSLQMVVHRLEIGVVGVYLVHFEKLGCRWFFFGLAKPNFSLGPGEGLKLTKKTHWLLLGHQSLKLTDILAKRL